MAAKHGAAGAPGKFRLDARLQADTVAIVQRPLCHVLLMNDARVPWLILVPARAGVTELHALNAADRVLLLDDIVAASQVIERLYRPDKLNVGALGNRVPQLHVHVIGRYRSDAAWPGPVWGSGEAIPYEPDALRSEVQRLREALG